MIDTHAHVHDARYDEDRAAVVERARIAGVQTIVTIGCDVEDSRRALAAAEAFGLLATVGIHPHEAKDAPADIAATFDALRAASRAPVVAIGETGLDYYYDHSPRDVQARVLRAQIAYAARERLPVVFHQRDAFEDFVEILRAEWDGGRMRGVVHCFSGDAEQAKLLVDAFGLGLGIGGVVTFKTADAVREAVRAVGLGPLVLETDAPYLAPVPHRGKRNEPAFVVETARRVAEIVGCTVAEVSEATDANARRYLLEA